MPPIGKADHDIVWVEDDIKAKRIKQTSRKIYLYTRADMVGLKEHMTQLKDTYLSEDHSHMTRYHTGGNYTKLDYYGIRGPTHKWISSWLSGRTQQVVLDGQASDPVPVLSSVPQGSVLVPIPFLIFINDLPDNIRSSVRLFAE